MGTSGLAWTACDISINAAAVAIASLIVRVVVVLEFMVPLLRGRWSMCMDRDYGGVRALSASGDAHRV
jgi:hypothetical protein